LTYNGRSWRLPTATEFDYIASNINTLSVNKGANGLMLCDYVQGKGSAYCKGSNDEQYCVGVIADKDSYSDDTCYPHNLWGATSYGNKKLIYSFWEGELYGGEYGVATNAYSARCVSDL